MRLHPIVDELLPILVGSRCSSIEWLENIWIFRFEDVATLGVECPWRIVSSERIEIGDEDDKQFFGHSVPTDAAAKALQLLIPSVESILIDAVTADFWIEFEGNIPARDLVELMRLRAMELQH
jgi:hypothetical protein